MATLIGAATLLGVIAVLAVWINRQVLNTDNWTSTSTQVLADHQVQTALSAYLVDQLFTNVDVQGQLKSALPPRLAGLAGPAAAGLRELANNATPRLLASPKLQQAWQQANRAAHKTFVKIINGGNDLVSTNGGVVTLNLRAIVSQLAASLGVGQQAASKLPASAGQLVVMRSKNLKAAQDGASAISGLAVVLPALTIALFALAVWLARGVRRRVMRTIGWCFITVGIVAVVARRVIGNDVVNSLVKDASNRPAAHRVFTIGTTLLYDIATAVVVYGAVIVVAAWLAGHTRPAVSLRRALAPSLRTRPVSVFATGAVALLVLVLWGPTPATRQPLPLVLIAVLLAGGLEALRRQTGREFPDAQPGDTARSLRAWYGAARGGGASPAPPARHLADLERLAALRDRGAITEAEFSSEKSLLVNGS